MSEFSTDVRSAKSLAAAAVLAALTACGGGGGGGGGGPGTPTPPTNPPSTSFTPLPDANRAFGGVVLASNGSTRAAIEAQGFADGVFVATLADPSSPYLGTATSILVGRVALNSPTTTSQALVLTNAREHVFSDTLALRSDLVNFNAAVKEPGMASNGAANLEGTFTRTPASGVAVNESVRFTLTGSATVTPLVVADMAATYRGLISGSGLPGLGSDDHPMTIGADGKFAVGLSATCILTGSVQVFTGRATARLVVDTANSNCPSLGATPTGVVVSADTKAKQLGIVFAGPDGDQAYFGFFRLPPPPPGN